MPTGAPSNSVKFVNCLGEIDAIIESSDIYILHSIIVICMLGDYNAHPGQ